MRNQTLTLGKLIIKAIGDVHLGRKFVTGVPLHRRGEREAQVLAQFRRELLDPGFVHAVVQVGDIFDKFVVGNEIVMAAYEVIAKASQMHPTVHYFFMRGNHDASRDLDKVASFDILAELCDELKNVTFVIDEVEEFEPVEFETIAMVPWHPVTTAVEMIAGLDPKIDHYRAVFGHWDLESYGGDEHNLIPLEKLATVAEVAITGHDHKPVQFDGPASGWDAASNLKVIGTGSMQPYAHGEEAPEELHDPMYLTVTLDAVPAIRGIAKDRCIRILLQPGETLPDDLDCLQLTAKRVGAEGEEESLDVELGDFDMDALFTKAFADVPDEITALFRGKFVEARAA